MRRPLDWFGLGKGNEDVTEGTCARVAMKRTFLITVLAVGRLSHVGVFAVS